MPAIPVFAVAIAHLTRAERVGRHRLVGVFLAVAGALVLLQPGRYRLSSAGFLGDLLVLLNCLSYAGFLVAQRPVLQRLGWRVLLAWAFLFGSLGVVPLGWRDLVGLDFSALSPGVLAGIAFILAFPTLLGYSLNAWAVERSSPTLVAAFITLQPLITVMLALPLLGEWPTWGQVAGFLLIAGGLRRVSHDPA